MSREEPMSGVTIRELAALCGVAVSTVSRAINGHPEVSAATRRRIIEMAATHDYVANSSARSLKARSTNVIAVLIQGDLGPLFLPMIRMFEAEIAKTEFSLMMTFIPDAEADAGAIARVVRDRKISGVIFLGRYGDRAQGALSSRRLADMGTPIVFSTTSDFSRSAAPHSSVSIDDRAASRDMTALLLERGHRRLAYLGAGEGGDEEQVWALRVAGFHDAIHACEEPTLASVLHADTSLSIYTMENGHATMLRALDEGLDATAIVCLSDAVAIGAIKALSERGLRVPEDVSVTGFDNIDQARFCLPGLTTVAQPLTHIAAETTRVLLRTMGSPGRSPEIIRLPGRIIERDSVSRRIAKS